MIVETCGVKALEATVGTFDPSVIVSCAPFDGAFDGVSIPLQRVIPARFEDIFNWQLISYKNAIRNALDAGGPDERVLVHCQHGLSRSAAIACALVWQHEPSDVDVWLERHPDVQPNPLLLLLADEILGADFDLLRRCRNRYKGRGL